MGRVRATSQVTRRGGRRGVPARLAPLFWNVDVQRLELERDADGIIGRVVEHGRWQDVQWLLAAYGRERIHRFFQTVPDPEVTERTRRFWQAFLHAEGETWPRPADWRQHSSAPWID